MRANDPNCPGSPAWHINCPISTQVELLMCNHVRYYCYLFSLRVLWTTVVYVYFHWILYFRGFSKEYIAVGDLLVSSTLEVYKNAMANLLPTPAKSHYLFNLRDFARVIQGTLLSTPDIIEDPDNLKRHWAHEVRNQLLLIVTCFMFTGGCNFEWTW